MLSDLGGFMTGAGHGSTIADKYGNYWHASTMRISVNHDFERRVGLFPAGFDAVSYTHLDVYKRQAHVMPMAVPSVTGVVCRLP